MRLIDLGLSELLDDVDCAVPRSRIAEHHLVVDSDRVQQESLVSIVLLLLVFLSLLVVLPIFVVGAIIITLNGADFLKHTCLVLVDNVHAVRHLLKLGQAGILGFILHGEVKRVRHDGNQHVKEHNADQER